MLTLLESRILGVLVEKRYTVPDTYPLTLNALTAGCNQKTSRDPILTAAESDVQAAIDRLKALSLLVESSGGRVMRYAHNVERVLSVPAQAVALLAAMMLRGPQTSGELRINCDRMHRFADVSAVEGFLHELAQRAPSALVVMLPRMAGARENRWMHLLSGVPTVEVSTKADATDAPDEQTMRSEITALEAAVGGLHDEIAALEAAVDSLRDEIAALKESAARERAAPTRDDR
ncbi:MAG: YceH family protein [Casimicrobiaceae bacterium]